MNLKYLALAVPEMFHGVQNSTTDHLTLTTPLSGNILSSSGWDLLWSTYTKFKVPKSTRYETMNGGAKYTNWDSLGQLGVTQSHRECHHSIERIRLSIPL